MHPAALAALAMLIDFSLGVLMLGDPKMTGDPLALVTLAYALDHLRVSEHEHAQ